MKTSSTREDLASAALCALAMGVAADAAMAQTNPDDNALVLDQRDDDRRSSASNRHYWKDAMQ